MLSWAITFQMTFAIITPALIVGAFAERMKFGLMLHIECRGGPSFMFNHAHSDSSLYDLLFVH